MQRGLSISMFWRQTTDKCLSARQVVSFKHNQYNQLTKVVYLVTWFCQESKLSVTLVVCQDS
eukprot:1256181-Amphidinium_carterae.1